MNVHYIDSEYEAGVCVPVEFYFISNEDPKLQTSLLCSLVRNAHNMKNKDAILSLVVMVIPQFRQRWEMSSSFLVSWGGVRVNPLGTSVTIWPIVPASDDR
jgi:hypothetical protein